MKCTQDMWIHNLCGCITGCQLHITGSHDEALTGCVTGQSYKVTRSCNGEGFGSIGFNKT